MEKIFNVLEIDEIQTPADNSIVLKGRTELETVLITLKREQCLQLIEMALMTMGIGNEAKALITASHQRK